MCYQLTPIAQNFHLEAGALPTVTHRRPPWHLPHPAYSPLFSFSRGVFGDKISLCSNFPVLILTPAFSSPLGLFRLQLFEFVKTSPSHLLPPLSLPPSLSVFLPPSPLAPTFKVSLVVSLPSVFHSCLHWSTEAVEGLGLEVSVPWPLTLSGSRSLCVPGLLPLSEAGVELGGAKLFPAVPPNRREKLRQR